MSDERVARFCHLIGCSGLSKKCPGDPDCSIVRQALGEDIRERIRLARAQGLTAIPNPFTDANDDYAVLEWLREKGLNDDGETTLGDAYSDLCCGTLYKIGDYARAAIKVLEDKR